MISNLCQKHNISKFIHLSALGIENAKESKYAMSKLKGEIVVQQNFRDSIILKPSIVYSVDDNFTTMLMGLLNLSPIFGTEIFKLCHLDSIGIFKKASLDVL